MSLLVLMSSDFERGKVKRENKKFYDFCHIRDPCFHKINFTTLWISLYYTVIEVIL